MNAQSQHQFSRARARYPDRQDAAAELRTHSINEQYKRMVVAGYPACDGTYLAALSNG
jgi:hypothetical protein